MIFLVLGAERETHIREMLADLPPAFLEEKISPFSAIVIAVLDKKEIDKHLAAVAHQIGIQSIVDNCLAVLSHDTDEGKERGN